MATAVCEDELFIGDEGTSIQFLVKECNDSDPDNPFKELVDISSATAFQITFLRPLDATTLVVTDPEVQFITDGTDSLVHYLTISTDLDQEGLWKGQLRVTMPTGKWYASEIEFFVNTPL